MKNVKFMFTPKGTCNLRTMHEILKLKILLGRLLLFLNPILYIVLLTNVI